MFTEEMVEETYGILTDSDDFIHIDMAVLMTLDTFGFDTEDAEIVSKYHKFYNIKSVEMFG